MISDTDELFLKKYGPGEVHVGQCPVCGTKKWQSTYKHALDSVVVEDTNDCGYCAEMLQRNPEIAHWVFNVVRHQIAKVGV